MPKKPTNPGAPLQRRRNVLPRAAKKNSDRPLQTLSDNHPEDQRSNLVRLKPITSQCSTEAPETHRDDGDDSSERCPDESRGLASLSQKCKEEKWVRTDASAPAVSQRTIAVAQGVSTSGVSTSGVSTSGVSTSSVATSSVATSSVATSSAATSSAATSDVSTSGMSTSGAESGNEYADELPLLGDLVVRTREGLRPAKNGDLLRHADDVIYVVKLEKRKVAIACGCEIAGCKSYVQIGAHGKCARNAVKKCIHCGTGPFSGESTANKHWRESKECKNKQKKSVITIR